MKRNIFIFLLVLMFAFVGCGKTEGEPENKKIILTTSNIENYINLSVYPDIEAVSYSYGTGTYKFGGRATTSGIAGYSYENVTITIKASFSYLDESRDVTFKVKCNVGGYGSGSAVNSKSVYSFKRNWMTEHANYKIVSVTGTCTKE